MLESSNIRRLPAGGTVGTADYLITNSASKLWANLKALTDLGASVLTLSNGVPGNFGGGRRYRGSRWRFFGTGTDDATYSARIYQVQYLESSGTDDPAVYLQLIGTVTVVLSTAIGATGLPLIATERFADTLGFTADPDYTAELTTQGAAAASVVNPTNAPATLRLSDTGGIGAYVIDFDLGTATGAGVMVERIT